MDNSSHKGWGAYPFDLAIERSVTGNIIYLSFGTQSALINSPLLTKLFGLCLFHLISYWNDIVEVILFPLLYSPTYQLNLSRAIL